MAALDAYDMNTLSFRTTEGHRGLSIELLIDGQSLAGIVGYEDTLIPYYLFEGDLPLGYWGKMIRVSDVSPFVSAALLDVVTPSAGSCARVT